MFFSFNTLCFKSLLVLTIKTQLTHLRCKFPSTKSIKDYKQNQTMLLKSCQKIKSKIKSFDNFKN